MFTFRIIFLLQSAALLSLGGCKRKEIFIPESPLFPKTAYASQVTKMVADRSVLIKRVVADTLTELTPGVKLTTINYIDYADTAMRLFIVEADLNNPNITLKAGTPNNRTQYGRQVVSEIARTQDTIGNRVIAAINGDFFNLTTGEPQSILFKKGAALRPMFKLCALCTYLAVDDQGVPRIGSKDRPVDSTKIREAVGGYHLLVKDSARVTQGDPSIEPRTGVGVTANKIVYLVVIDGRQSNYSKGMSFKQMSDLFYALGVKDAINLDGGGSSTLVVKEGVTWNVRNRPSDGTQRTVANAITVVSTQ